MLIFCKAFKVPTSGPGGLVSYPSSGSLLQAFSSPRVPFLQEVIPDLHSGGLLHSHSTLRSPQFSLWDQIEMGSLLEYVSHLTVRPQHTVTVSWSLLFVSCAQHPVAKIFIELQWEQHWDSLGRCFSHPCPVLSIEFTVPGAEVCVVGELGGGEQRCVCDPALNAQIRQLSWTGP